MAPIRRSRRLEHREEADSATASAAEATAAPATPLSAKKKKLAAGASAAAATRTKKSATSTTPTTPTVTDTDVDAHDTTTTISDTPAKAKRMSTRKKKSPTTAVAIMTTKKTTTPKKAKVTGTTKTKAKGKARVTTTSTKTTDAESGSREGSGGMDTDVVMKTEDGTGVGESTAAVAGGDNNASDAKRKSKVKSKTKSKSKTKAGDAAAVVAAPTGEENGVKPKSKRGRKPKSDAGARVADVTAVTESTATTTTPTKKLRKTKVSDKGKEVKKGDDEDGSVNPPTTTGSVGRKKRKADSNVDDGGAGSGAAGTSSARPGHASKKQRTSTLAPVPTTTINKSDPYSVLPTELWQEVMSYLSLSQITKVSSVSKGWLEGFRALQVWRDACLKGALGKPARKYPTHMALVCANSYWICEMCLAMIAGRGSDIPMPVEVAELGSESRMMCRECRCRYYKKHPEKIKIRKHIVNIFGEFEYQRTTRFTKTDACGAYCLRGDDLLEVPCDERPNPHYRNAPPMRLYEEKDVIKLALKVHGGFIGLQAARKSTAKTRREAFKNRSEQAQTRVILKTAKKSKKDQLHDEHLQAHLQELSQDPKAFAQSVEFYVDKNAHTWFKAISRDSSRAKIKEAIAEAEARAAAGEHTLLIKSTTPDRKWIDNIRNSMNGNIIKREGLKKIIENFEAGVYDTKDNASTAATLACGSGSGLASGSTETAGDAGGSPYSTQTTTTAMTVVIAQQQQ
ncbi:MAG: hypothetical protein J3R72DRAFT_442830 [Linnemannia gamsii]|nr:MAG: hypothetical protein J3R72DRAFT_442830 [Linnemannia gamsii]